MFEIGAVAQLAVSRRPDNQGARLKVGGLAARSPYDVSVEPAPEGGWRVVAPDEPEPAWRATFAAAFDVALARACSALAERSAAMLARIGSAARESAVAGPYDVC